MGVCYFFVTFFFLFFSLLKPQLFVDFLKIYFSFLFSPFPPLSSPLRFSYYYNYKAIDGLKNKVSKGHLVTIHRIHNSFFFLCFHYVLPPVSATIAATKQNKKNQTNQNITGKKKCHRSFDHHLQDSSIIFKHGSVQDKPFTVPDPDRAIHILEKSVLISECKHPL